MTYVWSGADGECTGRSRRLQHERLYRRFLSDRLSRPLVLRCPRTAMSLIQGYSSGEDEDPVSPTNDAFGLASLPAAKKPRVEVQKPTSVIPHSAPDVLSEVRDAFGHLYPRTLKNLL